MNEMIIRGVRGRLNEDGVAELNLEDSVRGLGFTRTAASGNEVVRWERVREYLQEYNVPTSGHGIGGEGLPEFIAENIFYRLCFKGESEAARNFQNTVFDEVLPAIRKHGMYATPQTIERMLEDPDAMIITLQKLKEERARRQVLELQVAQKNQIIGELKPKADYVDWILKNPGLVTITQIAKDYGMSGTSMNKLLHDLRIQYKQGDQWLLYAKYHSQGYTHSETVDIVKTDGRPDVKMNTKWTQKGRLFIYKLLKADDILPMIERDQGA